MQNEFMHAASSILNTMCDPERGSRAGLVPRSRSETGAPLSLIARHDFQCSSARRAHAAGGLPTTCFSGRSRRKCESIGSAGSLVEAQNRHGQRISTFRAKRLPVYESSQELKMSVWRCSSSSPARSTDDPVMAALEKRSPLKVAERDERSVRPTRLAALVGFDSRSSRVESARQIVGKIGEKDSVGCLPCSLWPLLWWWRPIAPRRAPAVGRRER